MSFELVLFIALGGLAIVFAIGMLLSDNAVHSALFLIGNFGCVAVLYIMLNAPFLGMVQIVVYTGAIMVLFLFVIMLLGAEETTDTTRRFRWLTGVATTLAISLLIALGAPLVLGGVNLPQAEGKAPFVRLLHIANVPDNPPLTVTIRGGSLAEPLVYEGVRFGDVTQFVTVEAETYTVLLTREDGSPVAPPSQVTLNNGQAVTLMASGEVNLETATFPQVVVVPNSLAAPDDRETRLLVYNGYNDTPVTLVDLGANRALDTRQRTVANADGTETTITAIADPILAENVAFSAIPVPSSYTSGTYNLAVINADNQVLTTIDDYELKRNTEQLVVIVPDADEPANVSGGFRPRVLLNALLATNTAATYGSPASVGQVLFTDYLLPFNIVGILLLVALVGVIVLTRPDGEKQDRRITRRRKVSRPLVSVISSQTGGDVVEESPQLEAPTPTAGD